MKLHKLLKHYIALLHLSVNCDTTFPSAITTQSVFKRKLSWNCRTNCPVCLNLKGYSISHSSVTGAIWQLHWVQFVIRVCICVQSLSCYRIAIDSSKEHWTKSRANSLKTKAKILLWGLRFASISTSYSMLSIAHSITYRSPIQLIGWRKWRVFT